MGKRHPSRPQRETVTAQVHGSIHLAELWIVAVDGWVSLVVDDPGGKASGGFRLTDEAAARLGEMMLDGALQALNQKSPRAGTIEDHRRGTKPDPGKGQASRP